MQTTPCYQEEGNNDVTMVIEVLIVEGEYALRYFRKYSCREKRDVNFSKWPIAGYPSESVHWSTKVVRQSGILSLNIRCE